MPVILKRAGLGQTDQDLYEVLLYQQLGIFYLAGIPGVILATYMVRGFFGRKWTLSLSLYIGAGLLFGFLLANYYAVLII